MGGEASRASRVDTSTFVNDDNSARAEFRSRRNSSLGVQHLPRIPPGRLIDRSLSPQILPANSAAVISMSTSGAMNPFWKSAFREVCLRLETPRDAVAVNLARACFPPRPSCTRAAPPSSGRGAPWCTPGLAREDCGMALYPNCLKSASYASCTRWIVSPLELHPAPVVHAVEHSVLLLSPPAPPQRAPAPSPACSPPLNLYLYSVAFSISLGSTPATLCMKGMTSSSHRSFATPSRTRRRTATAGGCGSPPGRALRRRHRTVAVGVDRRPGLDRAQVALHHLAVDDGVGDLSEARFGNPRTCPRICSWRSTAWHGCSGTRR